MARGYGAPPMPYGPPQGYPMPGMNMPPQAYGRGYAPQPPYGAPQGLFPSFCGYGTDVVRLTGKGYPPQFTYPDPNQQQQQQPPPPQGGGGGGGRGY